MLISSLRDVIRTQATEIDTLQAQLKGLTTSSSAQVRRRAFHHGHDPFFFCDGTDASKQLEDLHVRIATLEAVLEETEGKKKDVEKEQEDLLVLLDEMSTKRRRDKARMREAGLEVSEDEGEDGDDEGEEEEE